MNKRVNLSKFNVHSLFFLSLEGLLSPIKGIMQFKMKKVRYWPIYTCNCDNYSEKNDCICNVKLLLLHHGTILPTGGAMRKTGWDKMPQVVC